MLWNVGCGVKTLLLEAWVQQGAYILEEMCLLRLCICATPCYHVACCCIFD